MTMKLARSAELRASSFDESDNSIEVIWTTGAEVRRRDWRNDRFYQEVLLVTPKAVRLERLNAGAAFLNSHDSSDLSAVIGSVVPGSARIEGGKGLARIRLSNSPGDADIVSKIRDGIIRNISVGYRIHKVEKTENGDGQDDVWRVVDWEPLEISAVPVPADAGSQIRSGSDDAEPDFVVNRSSAIGAEELDEETADAVRFAMTAASVRGTNESPTEVADWAFDALLAKTRSPVAAGIGFGVALALSSDPEALSRAVANDDDEETDDGEANV